MAVERTEATKKSPSLAAHAAPSKATAPPSADTVLPLLAEARLLDLCRLFGCEVHGKSVPKERVTRLLADHLRDRLPALLRELGRDELRAVCRRHGLDASARARSDLQALVLDAAGLDPRAVTVRPPAPSHDGLPARGQTVHARHRQWLVDEVKVGEGDESPVVRLVCLDDDDPGRVIEVLWNLELGARAVTPEQHGIGSPPRLDPPPHFGAYLHALKWSTCGFRPS